jgi:predicted PurR-regulated permease PerM
MAELLEALRRHRLGVFVLACGLVLLWLVWTARGALPAFIIGIALAFVLDPVVTLFERWRIPRWLGVILSYILVVAFFWVVLAFALPPISRQARDFITHLPELGASITNAQNAVIDWYRSLPLPADLRGTLDESIKNAEASLLDAIRGVLGPTVGTLLRTVAFLAGLVIIPVWLFFVLKDRAGLRPAIARAVPETWQADADNVLSILARVGGRWVRGELLLGTAIFAATIVGLLILTLVGFTEFGQFTLILALIAGILEWFPIIGPIVAAIPALLIALSISPAAALAVVLLYTGIQQLENNLLVPKVMGDAVELHPAVLIVALVVGGGLFGIGGAILAAPVVAMGRDLYRYTFRRLHGDQPAAALAALFGPIHRPAPDPSDDEPPPEESSPAPA